MTPECPDCGSDMVLRVARRGKNAGNEFWGCSRFPNCRGIRNKEDTDGSSTTQSAAAAPGALAAEFRPRVDWVEPSSARDWDTFYAIGGGRLRSTSVVQESLEKQYPEALRRLQQTFIAVSPPDLPSGNDPQVTQVVGTFRKVLQRGDAPPHEPDVERELLERVGVTESQPAGDPGDASFTVDDTSLPITEDEIVAAALGESGGFDPRDDFQFDSPEERSFAEWLANAGENHLARWLYPQPPYSALLGDPSDARRADFLIAPPWTRPLVVEIDGKQHETQLGVDEDRDAAVADAGFEVQRIHAQQVRDRDAAAFPVLERPSTTKVDIGPQLLVHGPAQITRLGLAIAEALDRGFLPLNDPWNIKVTDRLGIADFAVQSLIELLAAVDELWAGWVAPSEVRVTTDETSFLVRRRSQTHYQRTSLETVEAPHVVIELDYQGGPQDALERTDSPKIIMRPATLPMPLAAPHPEGALMAVAQDPRSLEEPLHRILQYVFAKKEFKEGQLRAITQSLQGKDCLVLLPTGAGKSLIYQMAGLLLPGRTLIVDPIVALMEDQVEGLRNYGIDRAVAISSFLTQQGLVDQALEQVRNGDGLFFFISPERLQTQNFRDSLQQLTATTPINLVTVDEAHCISEWGHDFRPAYLNMGPLVRRLCKSASGDSPPILALTGTASRAVLRDVLIELDLDRRDPDGVIKPETFDRQELSFEVVKAAPGETRARLIGAIKSIPQSLGERSGQFFDRSSRPPNLGIVFAPFVNGEFGVAEVSKALRGSITPHLDIYSGGPPYNVDKRSWDQRKRKTAHSFRKGEVVLLCATKAFGMGVDIPNIRFTVHLGLTSSIEAFYQEAGRAGRDRRASRVVLVFTERNARINERLLSDSTEGDEARELYQSISRDESDDVSRQLFFHVETFQGSEIEVQAVTELLDALEWSGTAKTIDVPFTDESDLRERAILRLIQVGAVTDYLKEWGSKKFRVHLAEATAADLDESFLSYVARTQPGRGDERRQAMAGLPSDTSRRAEQLAIMAVDLLYDSVEKSRRRALREMRLLASGAATDQEIRSRIEDYFREGDLAPQLEQLTESTQFHIEEWGQALSGLTVADEGELRGATARLLESYPDHPGLLLGRALAELIGGDSQYEFTDNLGRAYEFGVSRYSLSTGDVARLAAIVLDAASVYRPAWRPLVWERVIPYIGNADPWETLIASAADTTLVEGERVMHLRHRVDVGLSTARGLLAHLTETGGDHER